MAAKPRMYLEQWCVRLRAGHLYVEGHAAPHSTSRISRAQRISKTYRTSRICRVLEPCRLEGSGGREYILEGPLVTRETEFEGFVSISQTSRALLARYVGNAKKDDGNTRRFSHVFPPDWALLRDDWSLRVGRWKDAATKSRDHMPQSKENTSQSRDHTHPGTLASETRGVHHSPLSPRHISPSILQEASRGTVTAVLLSQDEDIVNLEPYLKKMKIEAETQSNMVKKVSQPRESDYSDGKSVNDIEAMPFELGDVGIEPAGRHGSLSALQEARSATGEICLVKKRDMKCRITPLLPAQGEAIVNLEPYLKNLKIEAEPQFQTMKKGLVKKQGMKRPITSVLPSQGEEIVSLMPYLKKLKIEAKIQYNMMEKLSQPKKSKFSDGESEIEMELRRLELAVGQDWVEEERKQEQNQELEKHDQVAFLQRLGLSNHTEATNRIKEMEKLRMRGNERLTRSQIKRIFG